MKTDLPHLPEEKQNELNHVIEILHTEFQAAIAGSSQQWKRQARIQRIVLFGSYSRNDWVDESYSAHVPFKREHLKEENSRQSIAPKSGDRFWDKATRQEENGYVSDFDLLIIVSHKKLTDIVDFWYKAEDRLITEPTIKTPVNFIVHTIQEINQALSQGQYFFSDIVKEGIELYHLKGAKRFIAPKPLNDAEAYKIALEYYEDWMPSAKRMFDTSRYQHSKIKTNNKWHRDVAFSLHQTVERLYCCILLVLTNYTPNTHNIKFLRSLAENHDARLIEAWPYEEKRHKALFEILKEAYVKARYAKYYEMKVEDLEWLSARIEHLMQLVEIICQDQLESLQQKIL